MILTEENKALFKNGMVFAINGMSSIRLKAPVVQFSDETNSGIVISHLYGK